MDWRNAIATTICVAVLYVLIAGVFAAREGLRAEHDAERAAARSEESKP